MLELDEQPEGKTEGDDFPKVDVRLSNIVGKLAGVHKRANGQYEALCPAHDDSRPSLGVRIGDNGGIVLTCSKGCPKSLILSTIGYNLAYLRPDGAPRQHYPGPTHGGGGSNVGKIAATYDYCDADGGLVFQVVRFEPKDFRQRKPDGAGGWSWSIKGVKSVPYRLPELAKADPLQTVFVVEGEKDTDRLASAGLLATCNPMGASAGSGCKWTADHSAYLKDRHVVIIPDNDNAGRDHANGVAKSLSGVAASVKILQLEGLPEKGDVSDWFSAGGTPEQLQQLAAGAPSSEKKIEPVKMMTARELAATEFKREFIVSQVLTAGEPMLIAGPPKSLKTSITLDMALSIGTGTKFLGHFQTNRRRVGILSAESGEITIQETMRRISSHKGIDMADADVLVGFETPCLGSDEGLATFGQTIKERGIQVMVVDPVYLSLLGPETKGINAANLFDVGPLLRRIVGECKQHDCTLILLHHVSKGSQRAKGKFDDLELSDMSMSGFAEFSRQWLLIGRRENYCHNGYHQMKVLIGGSAGHGGGYAVDVSEGVVDDYGGGRRWEVEVRTLHDESERREREKKESDQYKLEKDLHDVLTAMQKHPAGESKTVIGVEAQVDRNRIGGLLEILESRGQVTHCRIQKSTGKGSRGADGWMPVTERQLSVLPTE